MLQTGNKSGFTLLEVILYVAILGTLVLGIASFMSVVTKAQVKNQTMTEVDQQAVHIIETISQVIKNGQIVGTPSQGETQNYMLIADGDGNIIEFSEESGVIMIDRGGGLVALSNTRVTVSALSFENLARPGTSSLIRISFTLSYVSDSADEMYQYAHTYVAAKGIPQ